MKIHEIEIENFRGVNFKYDFKHNNLMVITGINGSGKSTIIDAVHILLSKNTSGITEIIASQVTGEEAKLSIVIEATTDELEELADRISKEHSSRPEKDKVLNKLNTEVFFSNKFKRIITIKKLVINWNSEKGTLVKEIINDSSEIQSLDQIIDGQAFNIMSRNILIRFDNVQNLNLIYQDASKITSPNNIVQSISDDEHQRISTTNIEASGFLNSLLKYEEPDFTKIDKLLAKFNEILPEITFSRRSDQNGNSEIMMQRYGHPAYHIRTASSGQKKSLALVVLVYVWNELKIKPILLLDEPENSLHPGLVSRLFGYVNEMSSTDLQRSSILVATHSSDVVASSPNNTFRIVTNLETGTSSLERIVGLEERSAILSDLGVNFHIDYVAQSLVFVESDSERTNGRLSDDSAYQRLIDPNKEQYLFISAGNKTGTQTVSKQVNKILYGKLKAISEDTIELLVDLDDDVYDPEKHTPFKNIEYIYLSSPQAITNAYNKFPQFDNKSLQEIEALFESQQKLMDAENFKDAWDRLLGNLRVRSKSIGLLEGYIMDELRENAVLRDKNVEALIGRFS